MNARTLTVHPWMQMTVMVLYIEIEKMDILKLFKNVFLMKTSWLL